MGKGGEALTKNAMEQVTVRSSKDNVKYTWQEVKEHTTPDDAWMVYNNKVYDVSNWHDHPGGAVIFTHAGDDMTDIFAAFHAPGSHAMMRKFYIGELIKESVSHKDDRQWAFEKGYRDLRSKLIMLGMFKSSKLFYAYKCSSNMLMWATSVAMVYFSDSIIMHTASALLMGLFWQQCGWLAHDFLHHQVFTKRKYGDLAGIFWGNLMQGYSMQWWKNKHNGHHAVPNLHNSSAEAQDGDPDIDTMPLLAWSLKQAQSFRELSPDGTDSAFVKVMIKYQAFTYFPILLLARISWLNESFKTAFGLGAASENAALELKRKGLQYPLLEKTGVALHHTWMLVLSSGFGRFSIAYSLMYFFTATCSCGLFLALVFGLGHNGMAVYDADKRPDFWKLQVTTTRNITGGHGFPQAFVDWLCGGLQYQVDHHLFPMMPRHNLAKAHALVKSFCKEWGVQYHEADLVDGTIEVLQHLQKVSDEFIVDMVKEFPAM
jgi:fatty acid desaturase/predicted heme/steroid binding protein